MGVTRYCLDTSAYSQFKRGDPKVVELIDRAGWLGISVVVLAELSVGFRLGTRRESYQSELDRFVAHPAVEILPVTEDVVNLYADIVLDLREAGKPLPANDIWIAALRPAMARRCLHTIPTFVRSPESARRS